MITMSGFNFKINEVYYVLAGLLVIIIVFNFFSSLTSHQRRLFETQAINRGGFLTHRLFLPQLNFNYVDIAVKVVSTRGGQGKAANTYIFCEFPADTPYRLHIFPSEHQEDFSREGLKEMKSSQGAFDDFFTMMANEAIAAQGKLDDQIKEKFLKLKEYRPTCSLTNRKFRFGVSGKIVHHEELDRIIQTALDIIEHLRPVTENRVGDPFTDL